MKQRWWWFDECNVWAIYLYSDINNERCLTRQKILWWCWLRNKESFLEYYEVTKYGWWIQYIWISDSCKRTAEAKHGKDKLKQEEDWKKGFEFKLEHNLLCKYIFT